MGSPLVRLLQTNTIAVHGATPNNIIPAMYCLESSGESKLEKNISKKRIPNIAIVNGLMIQLMIKVKRMPLGLALKSIILAKSIFIIIGSIITQIKSATKRFTL